MQASQTAFLDEEMRWKIEKGSFTLMVGASSRDIRLKASVEVTDSRFIDGKTSAVDALAEYE